MTSIMLLGATGTMGVALQHALASTRHRVTTPSRAVFDATQPHLLPTLLNDFRPTVVINAIAMLGVDACERQPDRATALNTVFPRILAESCRNAGIRLLHFSSDAVFGDRDRAYTESDRPEPLNLYGVTKFGGDALIRSTGVNATIVRVPTLFGPGPRSFLARMLTAARRGERLRVAHDVHCTPTYTLDVARRVVDLIDDSGPELVHLAGAEHASLYQLTRAAIEQLGLGVSIEPVSHTVFGGLGRKNRQTRLQSERVTPLPGWTQRLSTYLANQA